MADTVVTLLENFIEVLSSYGQDQYRWQTGMKKEVESLQENYPKIQAVISTAMRAQTEDQNSALNKWIWQLRDAIDEADDLLDNFEYNKHKKKGIRRNLIQVCRRAVHIDRNLKRLEEAVQKLDRVSAKVSDFLHLLENIKQEQREQQVESHKSRETGSLPKNVLIGRDENKKFVHRWLRQPSDVTATDLFRNISLLSIVCHGGMGKTTLLQHVYQDEIKEEEFQLKMWVCVSDNFDVKKVIADMLECLQKKRPSLETLDALQESLQLEVMSKKFLLVLDDLWDKEKEAVLSNKWWDVLIPLAYGGLGSKILITTRMDSVASMIAKVIRKKKETLRLEGLKEDDCLRLLTTHAFADVESPYDHKKLRSIGGELAKKLYGSPLAAKVMGGVLNSRLDEGHWRNVLNNSLGLNDLFLILKLSYIFLPEHLQSCFSFCSIFAQDHIFYKDDLVRMWIAVGFIPSSQNNQGETLTPEDIGEGYFDVLLKKSFFDKVSTNGYKMHDLLHELARSVSTQECFRFEGDKKLHLGVPETIRHLFVKTSNPEVLKEMRRFKNLRTLFVTCYNQDVLDALIEVFKVTRSIRLLHINDLSLELKVEAIEFLHHLRYLRLPVSKVEQLPRSLSKLYHLQFIISGEVCPNTLPDDNFPRDMNKLSNLRYLSDPWLLKFPGIGNLVVLQQLKEFIINNKNDYRIKELEHMNELCILGLTNLKNVTKAEEACNAKLLEKRKLAFLSLNWNYEEVEIAQLDNAGSELDERVLNELQPHDCLKTLQIKCYMGARSAKWMDEADSIKNLEEISLFSCLKWEILPKFGQLRFLKTLLLESMPKVKLLQNKFPFLERLILKNLEALVDWFDASVVHFFPCLIEVELSGCPNLKETPYLPPKLKSLKIYNIGWKTLICISKSIPLETLEVRCCQNITSISLAGEIGKLKRLTIIDQHLNETSISQTGEFAETNGTDSFEMPQSNFSRRRRSRRESPAHTR